MTNNPEIDPRCADLAGVLTELDRNTIVPAADPSREAALLAAFDASRGGVRAGMSRIGWVALAATLTVVTLAGLTAFRNTRRIDPPSPSAAESDTSEFYIWPGAESLPRFESGQLVRMDLPDAGVRADVLIGQDGLPRAYRVVFNVQPETQP